MRSFDRILKFILMVFLVAVVAFGVMLWQRQARSGRISDGHENIYEYNLDAYRKVAPGLIHYVQGNLVKPLGVKNLRGLAVDSLDRIYVAGDSSVVILDKDGKLVSGFKLEEPARCLAAGGEKGENDIFLGMRDHVEVYGTNGVRKAAWESLGKKSVLTSIAVAADDVFVADYGNCVVWRFNKSGKLLNKIEGKDESRGVPGFRLPSPYFDVALGPGGALWVVDPGHQRVENFTYDGKLVSSWGKSSMEIDGFCGCCNPTHIAIRADGAFVTSEKGLVRVKVYDKDGKLNGVVAAPDQFAAETVGLDLAVDSRGRVIVLDPQALGVRIFSEKTAVAGVGAE